MQTVGSNVFEESVPEHDKEHAASDTSYLLGDFYIEYARMFAGLGQLFDSSTKLEPHGLISGVDNKYNKRLSEFRYGYGLSFCTNNTVSPRYNTAWYALGAGSKLPQGLGIVKDKENDGRLLTNLESMTISDFAAKVKQLEHEKWTFLFKIHNIPGNVSRALAKAIKDDGFELDVTYADIGTDSLVKILDKYCCNHDQGNRRYEQNTETRKRVAKGEKPLKQEKEAQIPITTLGSHFDHLSKDVNFSGDSPIMNLSAALLELVQNESFSSLSGMFTSNEGSVDPDLQNQLFAKIREISDGDNSSGLRGEKQQQRRVAEFIESKICDLKSIEIKVPPEFARQVLDKFKYCNHYRLPILLNKQWLMYTLGFRGLEKHLQLRHRHFYGDYDREDNGRTIDSLILNNCRMLDDLYSKFMNISSDLLDVSNFGNADRVWELRNRICNVAGELLGMYNNHNKKVSGRGMKMILDQMMQCDDLSFQAREDIDDIVREAFYLNNICNVIFSMGNNGEDDFCKINFNALFTQNDVKQLKRGVAQALQESYQDLYYLQMEGHTLRNDCVEIIQTLYCRLECHLVMFSNAYQGGKTPILF